MLYQSLFPSISRSCPFFYSEYWYYRLVLSFCAKAEVHSFEVRVGMRLSDYVVRVLIYYNLPDLLRCCGWCSLSLHHQMVRWRS